MLETAIVICAFGLGVYAGKRRCIGYTWKEVIFEVYKGVIDCFARVPRISISRTTKEKTTISERDVKSDL